MKLLGWQLVWSKVKRECCTELVSVFSYSLFANSNDCPEVLSSDPLSPYLDCVTATSSPVVSQTCFKHRSEIQFQNITGLISKPPWDEPWTASYQFLRYSLLVFISAVLFVVFLFLPTITWLWHLLGCLTDRTSETCKYLKDFSEISPSHIDLCIKLKKKMNVCWMVLP